MTREELEIIRKRYEGHKDVTDIIDNAIKQIDMRLQREYFQTAQGTTQATAPRPIGQEIPFQKRQMFNPNNLAGTGGSLLQMSPPFDPSIRGQLTANRKREDMLFGIPMYYG
jgi:hypothetical protein